MNAAATRELGRLLDEGERVGRRLAGLLDGDAMSVHRNQVEKMVGRLGLTRGRLDHGTLEQSWLEIRRRLAGR